MKDRIQHLATNSRQVIDSLSIFFYIEKKMETEKSKAQKTVFKTIEQETNSHFL